MKQLFIFAISLVAMGIAGCSSTKESMRDLSYEAYCDSIWEVDPDYYQDVLIETDEYCTYIEKHGEWWK